MKKKQNKQTCMAFPFKKGSKTTKYRNGSSWREKNDNAIYDLRVISIMYGLLEFKWKDITFLYAPLLGSWFWFLFKVLIYACVKGPRINCRQCMARTGVGGEHVSFSIVFGLFFRPLLHMIGWVRDIGVQMRQSTCIGAGFGILKRKKGKRCYLHLCMYLLLNVINCIFNTVVIVICRKDCSLCF